MSKKPNWFKGIFPALVTPFTGDDKLDETAYRELIRYLLPHVDGLVPSGTTGEFSYMTEAERLRSIEIALEEADGKPVVAGTGCMSTRATARLTRAAKDAGAAAALVVAPYYLKPTFNEIYEHYQEIDKIGLPIILYNIPQCAGTHYKWWTAEGMATDFDNVVGIKDSSGDVPFLMALLEKVKGLIGIFTGHDETLAAALAAGADGAILASANLIPDIEQEIYQAVQRRDLETAHRRQQQIQILVRIVVRKGANQAVKEGLRMMGLKMSDSRLPIMPGGAFEREDREDLRTQLENLGKIGKKPVKFPVGSGLVADYAATPATPPVIGDLTLRVGEGFAGPPFSEIAHIDLLLGLADGPVGRALTRALQQGRPRPEPAHYSCPPSPCAARKPPNWSTRTRRPASTWPSSTASPRAFCRRACWTRCVSSPTSLSTRRPPSGGASRSTTIKPCAAPSAKRSKAGPRSRN
jgi:4-hydroxy-tetrahydrodipicolinate synthase